MRQPVTVTLGVVQRGPRGIQGGLRVTHRSKRGSNGGQIHLCKGIEQRAMSGRREQPAVIMLSVDFHKPRTDITQQRSRNRLVVDERTAPAIGFYSPTHDKRFVCIGIEVIRHQRRRNRSIIIECSGDARLSRALSYQSGGGTTPKRKPERIQQDRFPRARLAGNDNQSGIEIQVERFDQHDIANGKRLEHAAPIQSGGVFLHQFICARIPFRTRIVRAQNRCGLFRFFGHAQRQIAFGQP